jgi:hypothetical protein
MNYLKTAMAKTKVNIILQGRLNPVDFAEKGLDLMEVVLDLRQRSTKASKKYIKKPPT